MSLARGLSGISWQRNRKTGLCAEGDRATHQCRYPASVPIGMRIPHITDVFRSLHAGEIGHFTLGLLSAGVPKQSRNTERLRRFHGFSPTGPVLGPKFEDPTRSVAATSVLCSATLTLDLLGPDSNLAGSVRARTWIRSCLLSLSHRARRVRAR